MPRMSRADILEAAATALLIPGAWTQGFQARNASGHVRWSDCRDACSFCAMGAISAVPTSTSTKKLSTIIALAQKVGGSVPDWNDAKGQTAENVAKTMFEVAAELRAKR